MASLEGFYNFISTSSNEKDSIVSVRLNPDHQVYEGHFPGKPVAPGAALTQMVLDEVLKLPLAGEKVSQLRQVKFLAVIDPNEVQDLELVFRFIERENSRMFTCVGRSLETNYFKLNGVFG